MKWIIGSIIGFTTIGTLTTTPIVSNSQSPTPINQPVVTNTKVTPSLPSKRKRYKVKVTIDSLDDLKVKKGDKIIKGQVLSDRTAVRQQLEARKKQLEIAIKQMSLSLSPITEIPPPNFAIEEAAIKAAKAELELLYKRPLPDFRFKDKQHQQIFDKDIIKQHAALSETRAKAAIQLTSAIAQLEKARSNYQRQQYQHSLNLVQQQTNQQRQQYQLASLVAQQEEVEAKLRELVAVTSPYNGRVRRIKIIGQNNKRITAEIKINVAEDS